MEKQLLVIGGGPGGYVAAIRAAQLGARVTLVEEQRLGGTCLNRGCIPTKALYKSAKLIDTLTRLDEYGMELRGFSYDYSILQYRKSSIVDKLVTGIEQLMKANRIDVRYGRAAFTGKNSIRLRSSDGAAEDLSADTIIIATGSKPSAPEIPGLELPGVMSSDELLETWSLPGSMVIIGGGVIGIEFAGIYSSFGTDVTVLEYMPAILPGVEADLVKRLSNSLKKKGIKIETGVKVTEIIKETGGLKIKAEGKKGELEVEAQTVLVAAGRRPNFDGLELGMAEVAFSREGILVDDKYMTSTEGIYAIGDVIGGKMLAHVASEQGKAAAEIIMGQRPVQSVAVPSCIFTFPEIAVAGMTEDEAKEAGLVYKTGKFMFGANGKALAMGEGEGLVKVISEESTGRLLGVHIMGPHASDLIHEAVLAIQNGLTVCNLEATIHAHPTLSEAFYEAVLGTEGRALHLMPSRR